ncbi:calcium/sodium antiporter [Halobacterium litoreum]|uniref:Calcium/sodium antiporter n=1 Tax=Halobacterium litoreum TaxID=2039234 RepID=A0ABD5NH95_9EURY|nr:calcium/sodium antiporter [Halobacterium litoreum]UHH12664.1 calcium/sodium antiporter [Halobacterium litoreum]
MAESLLVSGAILLAGIVLLYLGAELLVSAASALALSHGVRAATVGVTVVAFATTAPELFVSSIGGLTSDDSIALGNIVGSNITNIGLVLGTAAFLRPMEVDKDILRQHGPFMLAAAVALVALALDGRLAAFDGAVLLSMLAAFTGYLYYQSQQEGDVKLPEDVEMDDANTNAGPREYGVLLGSVLLLLAGSRALIVGGSGVLESYGFSQLFIGLTIIAFGTSVPELATSVVSALRDEADFSIGNVVGSNIYNVLAVIGVVSLIVPISVQSSTVRFELPVMLGFTFVALGLMAFGDRITRIEGVALIGGYVGFLYFLLPS